MGTGAVVFSIVFFLFYMFVVGYRINAVYYERIAVIGLISNKVRKLIDDETKSGYFGFDKVDKLETSLWKEYDKTNYTVMVFCIWKPVRSFWSKELISALELDKRKN